MDMALTMDEIDARFDGEWVLIEDPVTNTALEVERGKVRFHGAHQDEMYKKARELGLKRWAVVFAGKMPRKMEYVL
jgi:hypothetical protein